MLSLEKNEKLFSGLKWFGIVLLAIVVAGKVPMIQAFLVKCGSTTGGNINVVIAWVFLFLLPAALFVLARLKPVSLIAVTIALFPFFSRIRNFFGIYAYTTYWGSPRLISGIDLFVPLLFGYLLFRYLPNENNRGWWLPSSKAFWVLAASGVMTQFFFYPITSAILIGYTVVVVQLLWYLVMVAYVNTIEDAYKIMWGIIISVGISILLTTFAGGHEVIVDPLAFHRAEGRLGSLVIGSINEYGVVLSSTLCLVPILFYRARKWGKMALLAIALVFTRDLLLTLTRGGYLALLSILGYLFILRHRRKQVVVFVSLISVVLYFFWDPMVFFLTERPISLDQYDSRYVRIVSCLRGLMNWPYFLTGFGQGSANHLVVGPHGVHGNFFAVWVVTGLSGLLGFCFLLFYSIWAGIKKATRSYDFEEKLVLTGLVLSITSWIIFFIVCQGNYPWGLQETQAFLTTEVGLLVALGQKQRTNK